ncbi:MAG: sigma-70 family RNA polymerase sigma factor, partial [Planctomycetes bacterium]|nr:sigma-70 family RNA polymerase sigma factor [Planctomycetota bacterium]
LYRMYNRRLLGIAHRRSGHTLHGLLESVDLVQSTWRDVLAALDTFEDRGPGSVFRWLHTCLIHKISAKRRFHHAAKRDAKRSRALPPDSLIARRADRPPSHAVEQAETLARVLQTLDRLPEVQRDVVLMHLRDGLTHAVISERIGKSREAVKKIYQRAVARLLDLMPSDLERVRVGTSDS